jgi:hypothetical protein
VGVDSGSLTLSGAVSANTASRWLTKVGAADLYVTGGMAATNTPGLIVNEGRLVMQSSNASSGSISVTAGTLVAAHASALGTGTTTVSGGTLSVTTAATANALTFSGGSLNLG